MGGGGEKADNVIAPSQNVGIMEAMSRTSANPKLADILNRYGSGQMSLQDAQNEAQNVINHSADDGTDYGKQQQQGYQMGFGNLLQTDPRTANRYMSDELSSNPMTSGLFGKGGLQDRTLDEEKSLSGINQGNTNQYQGLLDEIKGGEGFKLTPDDNSAYGQLSGNIARMYGTQESGLAQSLADRGLASAPSGAAAASFSGLQGNKMEQLANAQRQVLQDRVSQAMDTYNLRGNILGQKSSNDLGRLNSARGTAENLGSLGQTAMSNLYNRNMQGRNTTESELGNAANQKLQNQQAVQQQLNQQFQQQEATKGPSFGDVLGSLGMSAAGGLTGAFGGSLGGSLARGISNNPIQYTPTTTLK